MRRRGRAAGRARLLAAAVLLALVAILEAGCEAGFTLRADMDDAGAGRLSLSLALDPDSRILLGLGDADGAAQRAAQLFPWVNVTDGWSGGADAPGAAVAAREDEAGMLTLTASHEFPNTQVLADLVSRPRDLTPLEAGDDLTDLPDQAPLLADFRLRLPAEGDGLQLVARGGVGALGDATCSGDALDAGTEGLVRQALALRYEFTLPGGPGSTNADLADRGASPTNAWEMRYGDCDLLEAGSSSAGRSGQFANGIILFAAAGFIVLVLALRTLRRGGGGGGGRRRRRRRAPAGGDEGDPDPPGAGG